MRRSRLSGRAVICRRNRVGRELSNEHCIRSLGASHPNARGDPVQWRTLIADDIVWELAYAPAIGHPARLAGGAEVTRHVDWFLGAVEDFRFIEPKVHAFAEPQAAVAQVRAEAIIKPTGRLYRQEYVVFLRAKGDKIAHLREYSIRHVRPSR